MNEVDDLGEVLRGKGSGAQQGKSGAAYYRIKFSHSSETEVCKLESGTLSAGQQVVAMSKYGKDLGVVLGQVKSREEIEEEELAGITRVATDQDRALYERNLRKERDALALCSQRVAARGLGMKLIGVHFLPEESKVLFFFTADGRVDFRELVKDLVTAFRMRIELRQIGVRDESRVLGGVAVCGRLYCCHGVTDRLRPVSIKMAKEQNLSLNSMKISGPCGRLLCCLSYEYDFYREERRRFPAEGSQVHGRDESFTVTSVNIISRKVVLTGSEGGVQEIDYARLSYDPSAGGWSVLLPTDDERQERETEEAQTGL